MWSSKDTPTDMEEILNDTISPQELEVSEFHNSFFIAKLILSHVYNLFTPSLTPSVHSRNSKKYI